MEIQNTEKKLENTVNNVINSSNNIITNVMQSSSTSASLKQDIAVNCDKFTETITAKKEQCFEAVLNVTGDPDKATKSCNALYDSLKCGANNITMKGVLNANATSNQLGSVASSISSEITDKIKSSVQQENGILNFGDTTINSINNFKNVLTNQITNTLQETASNSEGKQSLTVEGGEVSFISMDVVVKNISDTIQKNNIVTDSKNKMVTDLQAETSQTSADLTSTLLKIFIIIIAILIIIGVSIVVLKIIRSKQSKQIELVLPKSSAFKFW
jgi:hypothetical protein